MLFRGSALTFEKWNTTGVPVNLDGCVVRFSKSWNMGVLALDVVCAM